MYNVINRTRTDFHRQYDDPYLVAQFFYDHNPSQFIVIRTVKIRGRCRDELVNIYSLIEQYSGE